MRTKKYKTRLIFGVLIICLGITSTALAGQQVLLRPTDPTDQEVKLIQGKRTLHRDEIPMSIHRMSDQSPVDTLTWRTMPEPEMNFAALTWGDTLAVWYRPLAACTLKEIRIYNMDFEGNMYIDLWSAQYDGHIVTKDSTDANGWMGTYQDGQWVPGYVMGHSPLGKHLWGTFPLTMTADDADSWVTVSTFPIGEPVLNGEPFFISMEVYLQEGWGIAGELEAPLPYHFFKYYAGDTGPDQTHNGWFVRSFSLWVEAVVVYYENTRPVISHMDDLIYTYAPGPYTVEAQITDSDFEDPGQAGIADAYLHWNIEGIEDSMALIGPGEEDMYTGQIPTVDPGDTVFYFVSATDWAGLRSANAPHSFARLEPNDPQTDILLVNQGLGGSVDFYTAVLDSLNYSYEYWDVAALKGIEESVLNWGWSTAILFGYSLMGSLQIPTKGYEGNDWAAFLDGGKNLLYVDDLYYWFNEEPDVPTFAPGDFAYDYFGLVSGLTDASYYWDPVLHGVPGDPISNDFVENPIEQTWLPSHYNWISYTTSSEEGVDIFFNDYGDGCGARYDNGNLKTVYLPWMLDGLLEDTGTDTVPKACVYTLMQNVLNWFGTRQKVAKGDVNRDGQINVLDVLATVNHILGIAPLKGSSLNRADCNGDGTVNILDALSIVNVILGIFPECPGDRCKAEVTPEVIQFCYLLQPYLTAEDFAHFMALVKAEVQVPTEYSLSQNYLNPFNSETEIKFGLPKTSRTSLTVYNVLGQVVKVLVNSDMDAGHHMIKWDAFDMPSGVYFCRLSTNNDQWSHTRRMVLLK